MVATRNDQVFAPLKEWKALLYNVPRLANYAVKPLSTTAKTATVSWLTFLFNQFFIADAPFDCATRTSYCRQANWTEVMAQYCPQTCGLCNAATNCRDVNSGCAGMRSLCENVNFVDYMRDNCAKTCGTCTSVPTATTTTTTVAPACTDTATNCATNAPLCNNAVYRDLMTQKCPRTCNRCGASSGTTCTDASPNCATWVRNGFCTNAFYTPAQRRESCARSCNLC